MPKLKKLELLGFKSFADRTHLEVGDGIVGVVGPNGCGKSNLADAISWVLGEQSARLLRGERMADVIFNGTGTRPPTGLAEVSITLIDPEYEQAATGDDEARETTPSPACEEAGNAERTPVEANPGNGSGPAPRTKRKIPAGEITVTRRLFRSGESEYLINGETSRLRDIQDLFMGTGLGPESYAIIEQGRIGQILSSKPSDRRAIIEEAAGVSKFKTRKRLAEAKLESSRQNLSRITDILEEVSKQVNSLKRQASKARRYRELQGELRQRLRVVFSSKLLALETECRRLREELGQIEARWEEATARLEEKVIEQKAASERYEQVQARLTELREKIAQADLNRERLESRAKHLRQQISHLEAREADALRETSEIQAQHASLETQAQESARQSSELERESASATEAAAELLSRQEALGTEVQRVERDLEACRRAALDAVGRAAELRNQIVQAEEIRLSLERQRARAESEKAEADEDSSRLSAELDASERELKQSSALLAQLTLSAAQIAARLESSRAEEETRRRELEDLRQESSRVAARKQALEESLARYAYSTESVRRLLSGSVSTRDDSFRPLGVLADFVDVSPGYEEVVEEFLKRELDGVVVERHAEARSGIALLRSEGSGRSTFFVTQVPTKVESNGASRGEVLREPGVIARLRDLVRFEDRLGINGDFAFPALENAYLVENQEAAERLAARYCDYHFLTPAGEHYHYRLVSGGKGSSAGPLALRREFRDLERRLADFNSKICDAERCWTDARAAAASLQEEWKRLTDAKVESEKKLVVADEKARQSREAAERAGQRLRVLASELATLEAERAAVETRLATLRVQLEAALAEQTQREEESNQKADRLRDVRGQLDRLAQEITEAQARASALEERTRAARAEHDRLSAEAEQVRAREARTAELIAGWRREQRQLLKEAEEAGALLEQLVSSQQVARDERQGLEEECHTLRARRDELGPQVDAARAETDLLREQRSQAEVARARAESDHAHHLQQCREDLNAEPAELLAEVTPETALASEALAVAEKELSDLKTRLENLGPVNMMALEELQEAEERYTFLETQRQDLLTSIEDTSQAIREIDHVSRQQFIEAFKAINGYFAETFRALFDGGLGEMRLSDAADPESGLDIVAQPPGKRLQNVLLLSGGEKALAALALLIAIFRYTPSPFCILDEVDAPLDESNVDRFIRMIFQMSRHTQFLLITHNKRTMEMAHILYGVTMEEPGVSKLVSVRFEQFEPQPAAAVA